MHVLTSIIKEIVPLDMDLWHPTSKSRATKNCTTTDKFEGNAAAAVGSLSLSLSLSRARGCSTITGNVFV